MRTLAARSDVDLTVYYCSRQGLDATLDSQFGVTVKWDTPLLDGYRSQFLPNVGGERGVHGFTRLMNPAIVAELFHSRYDAILVHGYEHATKWLAFLAARLVGTPIVLRGESQLLSPRSRPVRLAKELLLRPLFRAISICTYIGEQNRAFYEYYGVEGDRLVFAPYVVDNTRFQRQCDQLTSCRNELRAALNVRDDRPIVLAAGKLITKKQPLTLLRAYQQVRAECSCALVFMGTGEMRAEI
jgi:glycosyltransferase involved in cell wall biosynthesis